MTERRAPPPAEKRGTPAGGPGGITATLRKAIALHQQGQLGTAEALYREVLRAEPRNPDALHFLGLMQSQRGQPQAAFDLITQALASNPRDAAAHCNRGNALLELRRFEAALQDFEQALTLQPGMPDALNNRGNALQALGRHAEAVASYQRALATKPAYPEALHNLGNALHELGRHGEALASFDRALAIRPGYAAALTNRGGTLQALGRLDEALASYDQALRLKPDSLPALRGRGYALQSTGRHDEALAAYERALAVKPGDAETLVNRGNTLVDRKRFEDALGSYERALASQPDYPHLLGNYVHARMQVCDWRDLDVLCATLAAGIEAGKPLISPFAALGTPLPLPLQKKCAELLVAAKFPAADVRRAAAASRAHERIRIGYFSADLFSHATAFLMAGVFEQHDRSRFELIAFSFGPRRSDPMRARIEAAFDQFIDVNEKSDAEVADLAVQLGVDIAVDLKGFTQNGRMGIFSHRAAPVQVNYLGYPGTLGAGYVDYIIADPTLIPEGHRLHYTEKVAYLPNTYQSNDARRVIADRPFTRQEAGLPDDGFVFCCFNNNWKITPEVFDIWMRLLESVQGSVLWLFEDNPAAGRNLRAAAEQRGVSADRLVFAPRMANPEHLARHRLADLFLDTLPYNAHTTASDALWAGLPVLTRQGDTFAARVGASLLGAVGLQELVTHSAGEYAALALELARDPARLAAIRQRLAGNRLTHPLFDTVLFTRHLEAACLAMWERHQAGLAPDHIVVPA